HRFLSRGPDAARPRAWVRLPLVALACVLASAVFLWSRSRFGTPPAALALLLCVLSPDILAHGQIVTTDLGLALFFFLTVLAFDALTTRATPLRLLGAGLALGTAFATKLSAPILPPVLVGLGAVGAFAAAPQA